ncbi:hypothetical protein V8G54_034704 [Vigna mungo]|uniref:Uncharacterized protein n=1 Tax=Vigna mungo TaxID=3915 RepID=A0AAQ3MDK8_VIGMU
MVNLDAPISGKVGVFYKIEYGCHLRKGECNFPRLFGKKGKIQNLNLIMCSCNHQIRKDPLSQSNCDIHHNIIQELTLMFMSILTQVYHSHSEQVSTVSMRLTKIQNT